MSEKLIFDVSFAVYRYVVFGISNGRSDCVGALVPRLLGFRSLAGSWGTRRADARLARIRGYQCIVVLHIVSKV